MCCGVCTLYYVNNIIYIIYVIIWVAGEWVRAVAEERERDGKKKDFKLFG